MDRDLARDPRTARRIAWALWLVLMIASALRGWQIGEPFWIDELHTSWVVGDSIDEVASRARMGNQGPAYFWCVWLITQGLGDSELAVRLLSLAAGLATVRLIFWAVVRNGGSSASGLLAAALMSIDTTAIFYAQEARPYALVQLVSLLQVDSWCGGFGLRTQRREGAVGRWTSLSVLLFYLHYTTALVTGVQAAVGLFVTMRGRERSLREKIVVIAAIATVAMASSLAWTQVGEIFEQRGQWKSMASDVSLGAMLELTPNFALALGGLLVIVWGYLRVSTTHNDQPLRATVQSEPTVPVAWIIMMLVPSGLAWFLTRLDLVPLFHVRYLLPTVSAVVCVAALAIDRLPSFGLRFMYGMAVMVAAVVLSGIGPQWLRDGRILTERNENWPGLVAEIARREAGTVRPVFLCANLLEDARLRTQPTEQFVEYLRFPLRGRYRLPDEKRDIYPLPTHGSHRLDVLPAWRATVDAADRRSERSGRRSQARRQARDVDRVWVIVRSHRSRLAYEVLEEFADRFESTDARYDGFGDLWLLEVPNGQRSLPDGRRSLDRPSR